MTDDEFDEYETYKVSEYTMFREVCCSRGCWGDRLKGRRYCKTCLLTFLEWEEQMRGGR